MTSTYIKTAFYIWHYVNMWLFLSFYKIVGWEAFIYVCIFFYFGNLLRHIKICINIIGNHFEKKLVFFFIHLNFAILICAFVTHVELCTLAHSGDEQHK